MPVSVAKRSKIRLRPIACWDCGFESRRRHGCLSVAIVVYCQVEVSATGRPLAQINHTGCCASLCVSRNFKNEEALARVGLYRYEK
jgi:hypothetical protein